MVAIAYTDITAPVRRANSTPKRLEHRPAGDPLIDATTRLLSVPVRQVYALLWRAGLLVVDS
ncbi:MAG TPA: Rv1535 family protein [Mycobacterium sp.]|nr:Rv1535 family protein [Mycobacterium sp.]